MLTWAEKKKVFYGSLTQNTTVAKVTETVICSVRKPMDLLISWFLPKKARIHTFSVTAACVNFEQ